MDPKLKTSADADAFDHEMKQHKQKAKKKGTQSPTQSLPVKSIQTLSVEDEDRVLDKKISELKQLLRD